MTDAERIHALELALAQCQQMLANANAQLIDARVTAQIKDEALTAANARIAELTPKPDVPEPPAGA